MVWKIVCYWLYYIFGYYIFGYYIFGRTVATENVITENVMYYIFGWYYIFGCDMAPMSRSMLDFEIIIMWLGSVKRILQCGYSAYFLPRIEIRPRYCWLSFCRSVCLYPVKNNFYFIKNFRTLHVLQKILSNYPLSSSLWRLFWNNHFRLDCLSAVRSTSWDIYPQN